MIEKAVKITMGALDQSEKMYLKKSFTVIGHYQQFLKLFYKIINFLVKNKGVAVFELNKERIII